MKINMTRELTAPDESVADNIITLSVASSAPYQREHPKLGTYDEVLVISEEAINFTRLVDERSPFLTNHDTDKQIGVVEKAYIKDEKLYVDVRFSENQYAQRILNDIKAGIRRNCSIRLQCR